MNENFPSHNQQMVIFLSLVNPYRPHANGGSEDIRRRIEALAETGMDVHVFAIDYTSEIRSVYGIPDNVHLKVYSRSIDPRPWRWNYPLACVRRYSSHIIHDVRAILHEDDKIQKLIFLEGMQLFGLWRDIKPYIPYSALTILRVHNVESQYHASVAKESRGLLKLAHNLSSVQYIPLEKEILPEFNYIHTLSANETMFLKSQYGHISENIRLAYPIPRIKDLGHSPKLAGSPLVLCYFGDLTLTNNSSGLHWFCREVLPRISSHQIEMRVAGKGSETFSSYCKVKAFGFVDDLDDYLRQAHVMIAPIFSGAGIKIKVLDAIGYGKPLVTTPKGAEGFPDWLVDKLHIASSIDEYTEILQEMCVTYPAEVQNAKAMQQELDKKMGKNVFLDQFLDDVLWAHNKRSVDATEGTNILGANK